MALAVVASLLLLPATTGWAERRRVEWWSFPGLVAGEAGLLKAFHAANPDIELVYLEVPEAGLKEKILLTTAGGVPPGVTIVKDTDLASLALQGVLAPLDGLMKTSGVTPDTWARPVFESNRVNGVVYAISTTTDVRALFYNKTHFSDAGLDPGRPPVTWDELLAYSQRLSRIEGDGLYSQLGFVPLQGQGSLFFTAVQDGAEFISADGRKVMLDDPLILQALEHMMGFYDTLGGYATVSKSPALKGDPFLNDKLSMRLNGNWRLNTKARDARAENIDWAVSPAPVPAERYKQTGRFTNQSQVTTWSGGWRYAIPAGYKDRDAAWRVLEFITSLEGHAANARGEFLDLQSKGLAYVPRFTANVRADRLLATEYLRHVPARYGQAQWFFIDLLSVTTHAPASPVTTQLWAALQSMQKEVIQKGVQPRQSMENWQRSVQAELDTYYATAQVGSR